MVSEIKIILAFFLTFQALSLVCFPLMFFILGKLKDGGYFFSKAASLLLFSYFNFLLFSTNIFGKTSRDLLSVLIISSLSLLALSKRKAEMNDLIRKRWRSLIAGEGLFFAVFVIALLVRMGDPHIFGNTEKFPDYSIFLRLIDESSFPPLDSWMSGFKINYYYMGHFIFACLTRLSGVPPEHGVNLCTVLVFSLFFITTFSLIYNLLGKIKTALACALSACFLSHLDGLIQLFDNGIQKFDWWRSSRVIDGTINEFPYFAFLLGDLHAHYISLPFFMLFLGIVLCNGSSKHTLGILRTNAARTILISLILGFVIVINPWYFPLALFILLMSELSLLNSLRFSDIIRSLSYPFATSAIALIMFAPFLLTYHAPFLGFGLLPNDLASKPLQFAVVFAFPFTFVIAYLSIAIQKRELRFILIFITLFLAASIPAQIFFNRGVTVFLVFFLALASYSASRKRPLDPFLIIILLSGLVLLGCETLYLADNYGPNFLRMNTVFKFHWIILALLLAVTPALFIETKKSLGSPALKRTLTTLFMIYVAACLCYTIFATKQRNFHKYRPLEYRRLTLDGQRFQKIAYPNEYLASKWLKENTGMNDVILETTGIPFSYYARYSTFTARPTVLGWANHETVWRKNAFMDTSIRTKDIKGIYQSNDKALIKELVKKYSVKFIIVGYMEKREYPSYSLAVFDKIYKKVYENPGVTIYRTDQ